MAGGPGYWLVVLDNGTAGVARTGANQHPTAVGGQGIKQSVYLGASRANAVGNWEAAVKDVFSLAPGLSELPPPGSESAIVGSGTDLGTILDMADRHGAGILTKVTGNAETDPTFTILAGGLGGVLGDAVTSAADAAAAAAGGTDAAGAAGASAAGASAGGVGTAAAVGATAAAGAGLAGILGFLGNLDFWKGIGLILAGAGILIFAALELHKL